MVLPLSALPTAPAQGALGIEVRRDDEVMLGICEQLANHSAMGLIEAERKQFSALGGGCDSVVGCTKLARPFGTVTFCSDKEPFARLAHPAPERRVPREKMFPLGKFELFDRKSLDAKLPECDGWYVAKAEALPPGEEASLSEAVVWTSGVKSWQALAKRGVWVHGCSDGLGEAEPMAIDHLARVRRWGKLTHSEGQAGGMELCATYQLVPKPDVDAKEMDGKTHFWWAAGSAFRRALELRGESLLEAHHACGPGSTRSALLERVPPERVEVFLSKEEWLEHYDEP